MFRKESNVNVLMFFNSPAAQRCLPSNLEWSEEWPEGEAPSGPVYPKVLQQLSRTGRLGHQCSAWSLWRRGRVGEYSDFRFDGFLGWFKSSPLHFQTWPHKDSKGCFWIQCMCACLCPDPTAGHQGASAVCNWREHPQSCRYSHPAPSDRYWKLNIKILIIFLFIQTTCCLLALLLWSFVNIVMYF